MMQAKAAGRSSVRLEAQIARRSTPDFAWQTIGLAAALSLTFAGSTYGAVTGAIPTWLGAAINTLFIYALYTVVHEAVHANISSRATHLRWLDPVIGILACIPLWLFFDHHKRSTGSPRAHEHGSGSRYLLARRLRRLVPGAAPARLDQLLQSTAAAQGVPAVRPVGPLDPHHPGDLAAYAAVVAGLVALGFGRQVLLLWFIPWWIGQSVMLTLFTWTPHHDHSETGRTRNTQFPLARRQSPVARAELSPDPPHDSERPVVPLRKHFPGDAAAPRAEGRAHRRLVAQGPAGAGTTAGRAQGPQLKTSIEKIRRQDLVRAAYRTFLEHGLGGMTMARIGERTGMSTASSITTSRARTSFSMPWCAMPTA